MEHKEFFLTIVRDGLPDLEQICSIKIMYLSRDLEFTTPLPS